MAQKHSPLGELWDLLRATRLQHLAPVLLKHGVRSPADLADRSGPLLTGGVSQWQLEILLRETAGSHGEGAQPCRRRWDLPVSQPQQRASLQMALQAAQANHRQQSSAALDGSILAPSTAAAIDSRVRTYQEIRKAWNVQDFPISYDSLRYFAASLKAGSYRSASLYFHAIFGYQQRRLAMAVDPQLKQAAKDFDRAITRGMGVAQLKDSFDVSSLAMLSIASSDEPFNFENAFHSRDICVLAAWFMLREIELAGACRPHLYITGSVVNIMIPFSKTDQVGSLTVRSLKCACRVKSQPLCPMHAAARHLQRLALHPHNHCQAEFPLLPSSSGAVLTKTQTIDMFRHTIAATGTPVVRLDQHGQQSQRFAGHVMRVSGAQMLARAGVSVAQIQLLGRWSSHAVERYTQMAPLQTLPSLAPQVLNSPAASTSIEQQSVSGGVDHAEAATLGAAFQQELADVKNQLSILKGSLVDQQAIFLHRRRSVIVHQGDTDENANPSNTWRTRCGWNYGVSTFYRLSAIPSHFRRCKKCFRQATDQEASGSASSESCHSDSDMSSSSCSSSA